MTEAALGSNLYETQVENSTPRSEQGGLIRPLVGLAERAPAAGGAREGGPSPVNSQTKGRVACGLANSRRRAKTPRPGEC